MQEKKSTYGNTLERPRNIREKTFHLVSRKGGREALASTSLFGSFLRNEGYSGLRSILDKHPISTTNVIGNKSRPFRTDAPFFDEEAEPVRTNRVLKNFKFYINFSNNTRVQRTFKGCKIPSLYPLEM